MIHKVTQINRRIYIGCTITVASFVPDMSQELLWGFGHSFQAGGGLSI